MNFLDIWKVSKDFNDSLLLQRILFFNHNNYTITTSMLLLESWNQSSIQYCLCRISSKLLIQSIPYTSSLKACDDSNISIDTILYSFFNRKISNRFPTPIVTVVSPYQTSSSSPNTYFDDLTHLRWTAIKDLRPDYY